MYNFEKFDGDWILIYDQEKQGTIMPPRNQEESLKLRNSPEREKEITSISDFNNEKICEF